MFLVHIVLLEFLSHLEFDCVIIKHILRTFMYFAAVYWLNQKQSSMEWKNNREDFYEKIKLLFNKLTGPYVLEAIEHFRKFQVILIL